MAWNEVSLAKPKELARQRRAAIKVDGGER
jgi:hypothetical protein